MEINDYRVFYINSRESIGYIINLIETTTAHKIALVVHNNKVIKNQENLNHIKEKIKEVDKELVFISPDQKLKEYITDAGFVIFDNLQLMDDKVAASSEEVSNTFPHRLISLMGIILIFVLSWIYFYYPAATVVIKPRTGTVKQDIQVMGSLKQDKIDWENNILPLHKFEVTLTDEEDIDATGEKVTGKTKATGKVRFINEREEKINIPAGTILLSKNGKKYKTLANVTIPGVKIDYLMDVQVGRKAGQIEVKVEAIKQGSAANTSIGSINKLAHPIEKVHVLNPEPVSGGEDIVQGVVTEGDIKKLRQNLAEKMKTRLLNKIYKKLGGNYRLLEDEIKYSKIEYDFSQQPGDIAGQIKGSATLIASGYLLRNNELDRLATNIFKNNLNDKQRLISTGIIIKDVKLAEKSDGLYNIIMKSAGAVIPGINTDRIADNLKGNNIAQARKILGENKNIGDFKIQTKNQKEALPGFGFAIKVVIDEPGAQKVINID